MTLLMVQGIVQFLTANWHKTSKTDNLLALTEIEQKDWRLLSVRQTPCHIQIMNFKVFMSSPRANWGMVKINSNAVMRCARIQRTKTLSLRSCRFGDQRAIRKFAISDIVKRNCVPI